MANEKISQLTNGGAIQSSDKIPIARGGQNYSILGSAFIPDLSNYVTYNGATQNLDLEDNDLLASSIYISQTDPEQNNARLNFLLGDFNMGKIIFQAPEGVDGYTRISMLATDEVGALSTIIEATTDAVSYTPIVQSPNFVSQNQVTESIDSQTLLVTNSPFYQEFFGNDFQIVKLPDATGLQSGHAFLFANNSSGPLDVRTTNNNQLTIIPAGGRQLYQLSNNSTSSGVWNVFTLAPENVSWGSNGLNLPFLSASKLAGTDSNKNLVSITNQSESPSGTIDGVNTDFVLSNTPLLGSQIITVNGVLQTEGDDYTLSGVNLTFIIPPQTGDIVRAFYQY
jgi:hypothetical protein